MRTRRGRAFAIASVLLVTGCATADPGLSAERAVKTTSADSAADPPGSATDPTLPTDSEPAPPATTDDDVPDTAPSSTDDPSVGTASTDSLPIDSPSTDSPSTQSTDTEPTTPDGPSGVGDSLFPDLGNPGIDVTHYDVDVSYDPNETTIFGLATLTIVATRDLETFTLDQVGLTINLVVASNAPAAFDVADPELVITPAEPVEAGETFEVTINYSAAVAPEEGGAGLSAGWFQTPGGSYTLNQPDGARTWLPSNDHPGDKATYRFTIHVPDEYTAIANGSFVSSEPDPVSDERNIWTWNQTEPMTTYVIQVLTGRYSIVESTTADGLPLVSAILTEDVELMQAYLDVTPKQIEFFEELFGPYPFESYGIAMTDVSFGGAMEEQGRSLFGREDFQSGELGYLEELLLSHELAHSWFGNAVAPARWEDIWLNETFASYAEWLWLDHAGYQDLDEVAESNLEARQDGSVATGAPDQEGLFGYEVYGGGAVVLHALRLTVGDDRFFEILQRWVSDNIDTSRTTGDFIETAESVSGQDLTTFFDEWLYSEDLPDEYPR